MNNFKKDIDKQFDSNQGRNLFLDNENTFKFLKEIIIDIDNIGEIDSDEENVLIDYATDKALQEFCRVNQYYSFDNEARNSLKEIYVKLFSSVRSRSNSIDEIAKTHYQNLRHLLQETNPFAESFYSSNDKIIQPVACSEYSSAIQIDILQIDISNLMEPILDIGCGKKGYLVNYLRETGLEAYGIDRFSNNSKYFTNADWLEFEYGSMKWGTILSNLGFSNHFLHHHFRNDGNFIGYAKKYISILNSLKTGGCFHYAPDIPFIEMYLDKNKYRVSTINIGVSETKATIVKRLI
jgi:hypothetical protein